MAHGRRSLAVLALAGLVVTAAGCAGSAATVEAPAASVGVVRIPAGRYTGVITGREMATGSSLSTVRAQLTIAEDGRWAMRTGNGRASGRLVEATPDLIILEGRFEDGSGREGGPARYRLAREDGDDLLVGSARSSFRGLTVWTGIQLGRAQHAE